MKIIDDLFDLFYSLIKSYSLEEIKKNFILFLFGIGFILGGSFYYVKLQIASLVKNINVANERILQIVKLQDVNYKILKKEELEQLFLTKNILTSGLKPFIEQSMVALKITGEPGWKESAKITKWLLDESFEEERIILNIKNITSKNFVEFIQLLYKEPSVACRELVAIKSSDNLTVKLLISCRYKKN